MVNDSIEQIPLLNLHDGDNTYPDPEKLDLSFGSVENLSINDSFKVY